MGKKITGEKLRTLQMQNYGLDVVCWRISESKQTSQDTLKNWAYKRFEKLWCKQILKSAKKPVS